MFNSCNNFHPNKNRIYSLTQHNRNNNKIISRMIKKLNHILIVCLAIILHCNKMLFLIKITIKMNYSMLNKQRRRPLYLTLLLKDLVSLLEASGSKLHRKSMIYKRRNKIYSNKQSKRSKQSNNNNYNSNKCSNNNSKCSNHNKNSSNILYKMPNHHRISSNNH